MERGPEQPGLCVRDAGEVVTVAYGLPGRPCGAPVFFARPTEAPDDPATRERAQIAEILGLSRGYVCKLLQRAQARVREVGPR